MDGVFLQLLNMSFTGGIVIALLLVARLPLKKAPRMISYALWSVALFRLVCPFSIESIVSLLPVNPRPLPSAIAYAQSPQVHTGIAPLDQAVNRILPAATPHASVNPMQVVLFIGEIVWLTGVCALLLYSVLSLIRLRRRLRDAVSDGENVYLSARIDTPFVLGVIRPKIYLPVGLSDEERAYILLHEQTHIRRRDPLIKLVAFLVLCAHWFNPLVWVAFFLSGRDRETACDEAVIKRLGGPVKKDYASSLLSLATGRRAVGGVPLAFGEGDTKSRIRHVLHYKKPAFWAVMVASAACVAVAVCLLVNPQNAFAVSRVVSGVDTVELYGYKTPYVGDSVKVGRLVQALPLPAAFRREGLELSTSARPYAVTIDLRTDAQTWDLYADEGNRRPLEENAALLFSLIGNVDRVAFRVGDGAREPYTIAYTQLWADKLAGKDIRQCAADQRTFAAFVARIKKAPYDSSLDAAISAAILGADNALFDDGDFVAASHVLLATEASGPADSGEVEAVTAYVMAMRMSFRYADGWFTEEGASHMPAALTFSVDDSGGYTLTDYWTPRDGAYYGPSIRERFPSGIYEQAMDTQQSVVAQTMACYDQAIRHGKLAGQGVTARLDALLDVIGSSPNTSGGSKDYRKAHPIEYRELVYTGEHTLRYAFARFEEGGESGLRDQILAAACREVLTALGEGFDKRSGDAREWYEALKALGAAALEEDHPAAWRALPDGAK